MRKLLYSATALAAIAALPVTAHADNIISFGYSFSAGPPTTTSSTPFNNQAIGNGWTLSTSALGAPPLDQGSLDGTTISVQTGGAGTLFVYITATNVTGPSGAVQFSTTFDNINNPSAGFTEIAFTGSSYLSSTNTAFATTTGLTTGQTIGPGGDPPAFVSATMTPSLPYSLTEVYEITATAAKQQASADMDIAAIPVPEPASLAVLGVAMAGLGYIRRQRRAA